MNDYNNYETYKNLQYLLFFSYFCIGFQIHVPLYETTIQQLINSKLLASQLTALEPFVGNNVKMTTVKSVRHVKTYRTM
jgi:hypothetical protein